MTYQNTTYCPNPCLACSPNAIFGDTQSVENEQKLRLDYYVFGMPMHSRTFTGNGYKFGFNGQEKEDDIYGEGNAYDLGLRIYDARLARMFSIDPRSFEYPWQSPYVYHRNSPIAYIDFMGGGDEKSRRKHVSGFNASFLGSGTMTLGAEALIPNFVFPNQTIYKEGMPKKLSIYASLDVLDNTITTTFTVIGATSRVNNQGGLGGTFFDALNQANQGVTQIAYAEQEIKYEAVPTDPHSIQATITSTVIIVTLDNSGEGISSIEKVTQTQVQIIENPIRTNGGYAGSVVSMSETITPIIKIGDNEIPSELKKVISSTLKDNNIKNAANAGIEAYQQVTSDFEDANIKNSDGEIDRSQQNSGSVGRPNLEN